MSDPPGRRLRLAAAGDSIMADDRWLRFALDQAGAFYEVPDAFNRAQGGATARASLRQAADVTALSPDVVVLHAGTNDLSSTTEAPREIYHNLREICRAHLDGGVGDVVLVCVLPRSDTLWTQLRARHRDRRRLNALLRRMPRDPDLGPRGARVHVVDVERGFDAVVNTVDGLHPSLTGSRILGRAIGRQLAAIAQTPEAGPRGGARRTLARLWRRWRPGGREPWTGLA